MDKIISKINKLLELARRGGTKSEESTAKKMADELLAKYSLLIADIQDNIDPDDYMFDGIMTGTARATWQDSIYVSVARLYDCTYFKKYKTDGTAIRSMVGDKKQVKMAKKICAHLILMCTALAQESLKEKRQIRSYKKGFACRIWARVDEEMQTQQRGSLIDAIPEMKAAKMAQEEKMSISSLKDEKIELTSKPDDIDNACFHKGAIAANLVSLKLHDFLK
jgi:hypothetical protein